MDETKSSLESGTGADPLEVITTESKKLMQQIARIRTTRSDYERLKVNVMRALPPTDEFDAISFLIDAYGRLLCVDPLPTSELGKEMWKEGTYYCQPILITRTPSI